MTAVELRVGTRWPYPIAGEGLQTVLDPGEPGASLLLVAVLDRPSAQEIQALTKGRLRLGILPAPPLVWLVLDAGAVSLDSPYAPGLVQAHAAAVSVSADKAHSWGPETRGLMTLATVDLHGSRTCGLRTASLSRTWWQMLADALRSCSGADVTPASRDQAMQAGYLRWPATRDMLAAAKIVEQVGL